VSFAHHLLAKGQGIRVRTLAEALR